MLPQKLVENDSSPPERTHTDQSPKSETATLTHPQIPQYRETKYNRNSSVGKSFPKVLTKITLGKRISGFYSTTKRESLSGIRPSRFMNSGGFSVCNRQRVIKWNPPIKVSGNSDWRLNFLFLDSPLFMNLDGRISLNDYLFVVEQNPEIHFSQIHFYTCWNYFQNLNSCYIHFHGIVGSASASISPFRIFGAGPCACGLESFSHLRHF